MVIIGGAGVPASPTPSVQSAEQTPVPEPTPDDGGRKKRVPWTPEEDKLLADVVAALELAERGTTDWVKVSNIMQSKSSGPARNCKQCRERYRHYVKDGLSTEPWTAAEDAEIISAQRTKGNKWADIAKLLPGRTDNAIKNRWYTVLMKQVDPLDLLTSAANSKASLARPVGVQGLQGNGNQDSHMEGCGLFEGGEGDALHEDAMLSGLVSNVSLYNSDMDFIPDADIRPEASPGLSDRVPRNICTEMLGRGGDCLDTPESPRTNVRHSRAIRALFEKAGPMMEESVAAPGTETTVALTVGNLAQKAATAGVTEATPACGIPHSHAGYRIRGAEGYQDSWKAEVCNDDPTEPATGPSLGELVQSHLELIAGAPDQSSACDAVSIPTQGDIAEHASMDADMAAIAMHDPDVLRRSHVGCRDMDIDFNAVVCDLTQDIDFNAVVFDTTGSPPAWTRESGDANNSLANNAVVRRERAAGTGSKQAAIRVGRSQAPDQSNESQAPDVPTATTGEREITAANPAREIANLDDTFDCGNRCVSSSPGVNRDASNTADDDDDFDLEQLREQQEFIERECRRKWQLQVAREEEKREELLREEQLRLMRFEQRQLMRSHSAASGDASNGCNGCHGTKRPLTAQAKLGITPFDAGSVLLRLPSDASGLSRDRHASGADTARSIQSTVSASSTTTVESARSDADYVRMGPREANAFNMLVDTPQGSPTGSPDKKRRRRRGDGVLRKQGGRFLGGA